MAMKNAFVNGSSFFIQFKAFLVILKVIKAVSFFFGRKCKTRMHLGKKIQFLYRVLD